MAPPATLAVPADHERIAQRAPLRGTRRTRLATKAAAAAYCGAVELDERGVVQPPTTRDSAGGIARDSIRHRTSGPGTVRRATIWRKVAAACLAALVAGCASTQPTGTTGSPGALASVGAGGTGGTGGTAGPDASVASLNPPSSPTDVPAASQAATPPPAGSTPVPAATPARPPAPTTVPLSMAALRYRLVNQLGRPLFCDPDQYPVARGDEGALAQQHYPAIRADTPTYLAITAQLELNPSATPSADQVLAIYREWKMLNALVLQALSGGDRFDYVAASTDAATPGWHVTGAIDQAGRITLATRTASAPPPCPICLARGTRIDTPEGPVAVELLRVGMPVWTADANGQRILGRVELVGSTPVPASHLVVHLVLADGRNVDVSPGHPLPDGRPVGSLRPGDPLDGSVVVSADLLPYTGGATFDLLPSGPTGEYWANGILLASTLAPRRQRDADRGR